jgi:hypothetical protein
MTYIAHIKCGTLNNTNGAPMGAGRGAYDNTVRL